MGANTATIQLTPQIKYTGQVNDLMLPHGKGSLKITSQKQNKQNQWMIEGHFQQGQLIKCKATRNVVQKQNINVIVYQGEVKNGTFSGNGVISIQKNNIQAIGKIENGIFVNGQVKKQKIYSCCGTFDESVDSKNNNQNSDHLIQKALQIQIYLQLNGPNSEYCWSLSNQKVSGQFKNGQINGKGTYKYQTGEIYTGQFKNGYFYGAGQYSCPSIEISQIKKITGSFSKSLAHTSRNSCSNSHVNIVQFHNRDIYTGKIKNNKMHDKNGTYLYCDGTKYKGSFFHGSMTGNCEIQYTKTSYISTYKGQVEDGIYNGLGVVQYLNGIIFKGYFLKGNKNGPCIIIYGTRMWKCLYIMDQLVGQPEQIYSKQ